jgi:hypothetical protein
MSFITFKSGGKEVILNTDRIVSVRISPENGQTEITCTDHSKTLVDDTENEIKKKLGVKNSSEGVVGFKNP